jgi:hypothetical protein
MRALKARGSFDIAFGRRLPSLVERLGVKDLDYDAATVIARGGDPMARFAQMTNELLQDDFVARGVLTKADFEELVAAFDDPSFWFLSYSNFAAWGRRGG